MRQIRTRLSLLAVVLALSVSLFAKVFEVDGINYYVTSSSNLTVEVTSKSPKYSGKVVIPESVSYEGKTYSVTSIGEYAFQGCSGLTSVTIPNSVTEINDRAFYGCSGLTSATINCKNVSSRLFSRMTSIKEIIMGDGVTSIGEYAFYGCSSLTSVTIPNSVTSIGEYAFHGCPNFTVKVIMTDVLSFFIDNVVSIIRMRIEKPIQNLIIVDCEDNIIRELTIPNGVTSIGNFAFEGCSSLTSVIIPNSVTSIGEYAFHGCSSLTSVTIPNSVTSIGNSAFYGCSSLTSVTIPNSVTYIGEYAFYYCSGLTSVTIGNSVTSIGGGAFCGCSSLTSVTISNSVTSIGNFAFEGCSGLTSVTIPNSVTFIGHEAFYGCSSLTSVTIGNSVTYIGKYVFKGCSSLTSVTIPNSVISIESCAFEGCSSLTSVTIPNSVTSIGDSAFEGCKNLMLKMLSEEPIITKISNVVSLEVPKGCTTKYAKHPNWENVEIIYAVDNGVKYCPVFLEEEGDIVVQMKDGVHEGIEVAENETITINLGGESAPYSFIMLGYSDITEQIKNNGSFSFSPSIKHKHNIIHTYAYPTKDIHVSTSGTLIDHIGVDNIENIYSLKVSGDLNGTDILAIRKMTNLKLLDLEDASITDGGVSYYCDYITSENSIGDYFFLEKESLIKIVLPENTKNIKQYAFSGCTNLRTILIPKSVKVIEDGVLNNCNSLLSISFLCPIVRGCENRINLGAVFLGEGVTEIDDRAFYGCSSLTSVNIPNSVTSIGSGAFSSCSGLTSVTIPNSVTSIGYSAFYGCSSLTSVTIPNGVTSIDAYTFMKCSSLTSVTIPNSVTSIGDNAFYGCSNLTSINIPNSVTFIGRHSFSYCDNLSSFVIEDGNSSLVMSNVSQFISDKGKRYYLDYNFENTFLKEVYIGRTVKWYDSQYATCMFGDRIEKAIIGQNVTSISRSTFSGCKYLTSIIIPNSVTSIGDNVFRGCSNLTSVTIPNSVTSIGWGVFYNCSNLTSVTIPNSVTSIGWEAFSDCSALTSVTIPNSVTEIGTKTFHGCSALTSVTSLNTTPPKISSDSFDETTEKNATLYVPFGCKTVYWLNPYWENFMNIVEIDASDVDKVIADTPDQDTPVYNLQGVKMAAKALDLESLPKGIYIVNGKKYTVK